MTATEERAATSVGQPLRRKEDDRLVTGRTRWTDSVAVPGLLHVAVLRSPMAHARVTRVDVSAALTRPGVIAAYSGADLADDLGSLPTAWTASEDQKTPPHPPVTSDKVRYVGDAVAVVVASSRYAAADALEAVEVDYEPLPAVLDMEAALTDGASRFQAVIHVVLPLALPGVLATGIFTFILAWNDYIFARILLSRDELKTLPVGIADLYNASVVDWGMIMAAGLLVIAPVLGVFVFIQRYMVAGWGAGGVKG